MLQTHCQLRSKPPFTPRLWDIRERGQPFLLCFAKATFGFEATGTRQGGGAGRCSFEGTLPCIQAPLLSKIPL